MKTFDELISIEIDYLGGGYYHPDMFKDGRLNQEYQQMYSDSGETMFDIDRKAGGSINTTPSGLKFWDIIDLSMASTKWKWNYKGGTLEAQLKKIVSEMIYPEYVKYSKMWLSTASMDIIESDDKLRFNFVYAVFNGPGWFKYFSRAMNIYVDQQKIKDPSILMDRMIYEREQTKNPLIMQGATIIRNLINKKIT